MRVIREAVNAQIPALFVVCLFGLLLQSRVFAKEHDNIAAIFSQPKTQSTQLNTINAVEVLEQPGKTAESSTVNNQENTSYPGRKKRIFKPSFFQSINPDIVAPFVRPPVKRVPDLIGVTHDAAVKILQRYGLEAGDIRYRESSGTPNIVLEQVPDAGQEPDTRTVNLVLSKSGGVKVPKRVVSRVPDLIGLSYDAAITTLSRNRFRAGDIRYRPSSGTLDIVLDQFPDADQEPDTRTVDLVLSELRKVKVPDLIGKSVNAAKGILRRNDLEVGRIRYVESVSAEGIVISQKPSPHDGALVTEGSSINLEVSKLIMSAVPDLSGKSVTSARSDLETAGFVLGVVLPESLRWTGIVSGQNPQAGSKAKKGSSIELALTSASVPESHPDNNAVNNPLPDQLPVEPEPPNKPVVPVVQHPKTFEPVSPIKPVDSPFPADKLLITGGSIIILGAGSLLFSRIRRTNIKSTVEKHANVYEKIDYGNQHLNEESHVPNAFTVNRDISICIQPDQGHQETQVNGPLIKSD
jgi:beta-lactam-binding protein with PASTA domain